MSVRGFSETLTVPIQKSFYLLRGRIFSRRKDSDLTQQLAQAEHEITSLKAQITTLRQENQAMRRLLDAPLPSSWQFLPAKVIGEEHGVLRVDKGSVDEVEGMLTVVVDGVFVGRVIKVNQTTSLVQTFKNSDFKLSVIVKPEKGEGILGKGLLIFHEGQLFLDKVLQEEKIQAGDFVLTSGEEGLAASVPIGKITKVTSEKGGIYKRGEIEPFLKEKYLETVFLIKVR